MNKVYAQIYKERIDLIGSNDVGLPLSQDYLKENPHILNIDITDMEPKPQLGWFYIDGKFYDQDPRPQPEPPSPSPIELRNKAYQEMTHKEDDTPLILFEGAIYTCDKAFAQIKVYEEEDKHSGGTKAKELGQLWIDGKEYIRALYPPENGEDLEPFKV